MKLALLALAVLLTVRFTPRPPISEQVAVSTVVWSADGQLLRVTLAADDQYRLWTPLSQMSPDLLRAFLLKEDQWFYWHPGVNPPALIRAAQRTYRGEVRQGGSTISMQLARLLYAQRTRTPAGKLRQIAAALWLEARYSKRELLEAYLNLVPYGGNVQGVGAASRLYFGKAPGRLTLGEAVTLAVIPQSPLARTGAQQERLLKARTRLAQLWISNYGASDGVRRQLESPIEARAEFRMPWGAPHFVDALLATRRGNIETTLDAGLQSIMERQIARYIEQYGDRGIRNTAALLVDTRDMTAKAWAGSANYWNAAIEGQVDGVLAKRSPGSALKPFIYGLALDQGVLHPRTILRDSPTSFGPFTPENFDGRFFGPIAAEDALIRSRNIPAVAVALQLKQPSLYGFLQSAGVSRLKPESHYGLALALGGGEVTMEELATLYAMLANQGEHRRIRTTPSATLEDGARLLSKEAAFITLDMLRHNPRPDEDGARALRGHWPVAWKTGTSWGFRDAWSAGVFGPYVLVVWIGDFSGKGNPSYIGIDAAAPLFFRIADAVNLARVNIDAVPEPEKPAGVTRVAVCAESGDLPNQWCPHTIDTWYIPGKSPIKVSQLHRAVAIDRATGQPSCPPYAPETTRYEVYEFWSSDMRKLFREAGMPRRMPPVLPDCVNALQEAPPRIASPLTGVGYALRPASTIALEASVASDARELFWFDGGALIGKVPANGGGALGWRPEAEGVHLIRAIDDRGRAAEREVQVRFSN